MCGKFGFEDGLHLLVQWEATPLHVTCPLCGFDALRMRRPDVGSPVGLYRSVNVLCENDLST